VFWVARPFALEFGAIMPDQIVKNLECAPPRSMFYDCLAVPAPYNAAVS
jgi:hypothetical protein